VDAIFILRQMIEKSIEFNKLFLCFVDLTKAFYKVQLDGVIKILDQINTDYRYQSIIQELNSRSRTRLKTNDGLSKEVQINTGIRQGDSFSPTLFNIIVHRIIENIKKVIAGYRINNRTIKVLCYTDDAIIIVRKARIPERYHMVK